MNKIKMGKLDELSPGKIIEKRILARRVAVVNIDGDLIGFESECKHMKASLAKGKIDNRVIECPWHSWRYNLDNGKCLTNDKFQLKKYKIEVDDGDVFLIM